MCPIQFRTLKHVISSAGSIHPELGNVTTVLEEKVVADAIVRKANSEDEKIQKFGLAQVEQLLNQFAPLTLLIDRSRGKKMTLGRKLINSCLVTRSGTMLLEKATREAGLKGGDPEVIKALATRLVAKKSFLPVPAWTSHHDAVLIDAIVKHGWLENDRSYSLICDDNSLLWGPPFEKKLAPASDPAVQKVGDRVIKFLNVENESVQEFKEIRNGTLQEVFNLVYEEEDTDGAASASKSSALPWSIGSMKDIDEEAIDLPNKKDMLKRARVLLAKEGASLGPPPIVVAKVEYPFAELDVKNAANTFLAELIRAITKVSFSNTAKRRQLGEKLFAYALEEAKHRVDDLKAEAEAKTTGASGSEDNTKEGGNEEPLAVQTMKKIVEHIEYAHKYIIKQQAEAKNMLRVILGVAPQRRKVATDPLFPVEKVETPPPNRQKAKAKPTKTKSAKVTNRAQAVKAKKQATTTFLSGSGERAIERAVEAATNLADDEKRSSTSTTNGTVSRDGVGLSGLEILLLTVMCSQGTPAWTPDWVDLIVSSENVEAEKQGPGFEHSIAWYGIGEVLEAAANSWYQTARVKHKKRRAELEQLRATAEPAVIAAKEQGVIDLERDMIHKRSCFAIAIDYNKNPLKLGKKSVLLLDKIRSRMGPIDRKKGKAKASTSTDQQAVDENGLGGQVLRWMVRALGRWADSLGIADSVRNAPARSVHDFEEEVPGDDSQTIVAIMSDADCRLVFSQVAQQSRVRTIFVEKEKRIVNELIARAAESCNASGDAWESQPAWWQIGSLSGRNHDVMLLESLLERGYSGLHEILADMMPDSLDEDEDDDDDAALTSEAIQYRAYQLTREVDAIVHSEDLMKTLRGPRKKKKKKNGNGSKASNPGSAISIQPQIQSFFRASQPAASAATTTTATFISPASHGESVRNDRPQAVNISAEPPEGSAVEHVGTDNFVTDALSLSTKRKATPPDPPTGVSLADPSPEKKIRVG